MWPAERLSGRPRPPEMRLCSNSAPLRHCKARWHASLRSCKLALLFSLTDTLDHGHISNTISFSLSLAHSLSLSLSLTHTHTHRGTHHDTHTVLRIIIYTQSYSFMLLIIFFYISHIHNTVIFFYVSHTQELERIRTKFKVSKHMSFTIPLLVCAFNSVSLRPGSLYSIIE